MTYPRTKTFLVEPSGRSRMYLRRYHSPPSGIKEWSCATGWHEAKTFIGWCETRQMIDSDGSELLANVDPVWPSFDDYRWPSTCAHCDFVFSDEEKQQFSTTEWKRPDTGDTWVMADMPPGAMWNAFWMPFARRGPDGLALVVVCPNGRQWSIDNRASNCTMPEDDEHQCWVRHGIPPEITVDKDGLTCAAGAGSILAGDYHGFLQDGWLTEG